MIRIRVTIGVRVRVRVRVKVRVRSDFFKMASLRQNLTLTVILSMASKLNLNPKYGIKT